MKLLGPALNKDSIKVINRLNKIVYSRPLKRQFGYQYPVDFEDLQNILSAYYLCDDLEWPDDDTEATY